MNNTPDVSFGSGEVTIRSADPEDAVRVGRLIGQLGYEITIEAARRRLVELLGRADHSVLVAVQRKLVVGVLHVCITEALEHEPRGEIRALSVDEDYRSRGIGARLIEAAEEWARERRVQKMRVRSNVKRSRARVFYERHGYEVMKTSNIFEKALVAAE
ncbi:MAG TPA: GNAT family N-acetyltransferase [Thermoanaerobaculia bacterium]